MSYFFIIAQRTGKEMTVFQPTEDITPLIPMVGTLHPTSTEDTQLTTSLLYTTP